ncbi:MAG TPA: OmpH family outer membrane protein [Vicinamibacterales bacterium]|nr:OmpH family outer membrane protein [Vicinamibacterales bacterium]
MKTALVLGVLALLPVLGELPKPSPAMTPSERAALQKTIVVSIQRVITDSAEGRAASQRLQALLQKMTTDLAAKQKELAEPTGPEFQRLAQQSQVDYANAQRQAQADIRTKLVPIVAEIAAQHGVDVILNSDTLVWAAPRLDVTAEVIAKLDGK